MSIHNSLVEGWNECEVENPPYLFPEDKTHVLAYQDVRPFRSFDDYVSSREFGLSGDTNLHIGLLPIPFIGNLEKASIFILSLNPGLSAIDYFSEERIPEYRSALIRNLRQENGGDQYPFMFFDPKFAYHSGFVYWQKKFHKIIEGLAKQFETTYQQAMSELAKNLVCLELLPYHSKSFGSGKLLKTLPSVKVMQGFVHDLLLPKAKDGKILIIVTRGVKTWGLLPDKNIIIYTNKETRSAYLTKDSRLAIANHLHLENYKDG